MMIMMVDRCEKQEGLLCERHKGSILWNKVMFDYNALSDQVVTKTVNFRVDESVSYDRQVTLATLAKVWLYDDTNYDDDDNDNNDDDDFKLCLRSWTPTLRQWGKGDKDKTNFTPPHTDKIIAVCFVSDWLFVFK